MRVRETLQLENGFSVLMCDLFSDEEITQTLVSNIGIHKNFVVEGVRNCFSSATTRNIVLFEKEDYSGIKTVEFK